MSCPNSDPQFDKVLQNINLNPTPDLRQKLYYMVCIWVRLILFYLVYYYRHERWMPYVVGIFSLVAIANLSKSVEKPGRQWWSKRFDLIVSILVVLVCIGVVLKKVDPVYMSGLLFASLFGGIVQSFLTKFC